MATRKELEDKIATMKAGLDTVPANLKPNLQAKIEDYEYKLSQLGDETPAAEPPAEGGLAAIAQMLNAFMAGGGGADSFEVKQIIKEYLDVDKVKLSELDQSVIDEITKNQKVTIELPAYDMKIEMKQSVSKIPNIFSMIDDVLAGNNVFLIGEAGGGKTYAAETIAELLDRRIQIINCSQYTSPTEILGGQTIEGYKEGKLIKAWRDGDVLILDEMPKLDPNTAGLFNDALAKSSKTREVSKAKINSTNPEEPPVERNKEFACIATGNIYPNSPDTRRYVGNNQQDLSLLDRFSGSVYFVEFADYLDQTSARYNFLYEMLVGNYHEYIKAVRDKQTPPTPRGLRTVLESLNMKNYALVSYRTLISFRVAFEYELVRALARKEGKDVSNRGKTVVQNFENYLVAFPQDARATLLSITKFTNEYIDNLVKKAIDKVVNSKNEVNGFIDILAPDVKATAGKTRGESREWKIAEDYILKEE
jgi:ABC-type dipeptide/oligopeptide/nickel transport system ATPase component